MYKVIWRYEVKVESIKDFLKIYDTNGEWVQLFSKSPDFIKTELFNETSDPSCFVTIDYWKSKESYSSFYTAEKEAVNRIDFQGDELTLNEERIGEFIE